MILSRNFQHSNFGEILTAILIFQVMWNKLFWLRSQMVFVTQIYKLFPKCFFSQNVGILKSPKTIPFTVLLQQIVLCNNFCKIRNWWFYFFEIMLFYKELKNVYVQECISCLLHFLLQIKCFNLNLLLF
jgi:hypothetical protein